MTTSRSKKDQEQQQDKDLLKKSLPKAASHRTVKGASRKRSTAPATREPKAVVQEIPAIPTIEDLTLQQVEALRELQRQAAELKAQIDQIKQELLPRMSKGDKFYTEDKAFVVSLRERSNWTYSQELQKDILYLEAEKKSEQQNGTATNNPTQYVDGRAVAK